LLKALQEESDLKNTNNPKDLKSGDLSLRVDLTV
jgi:hypothetical protein